MGVRREDRPRLQAQPTKGGARPAGDQTLPHLSPRVIEMLAPASNGPRAGRQACRFSLQRRGEDEKCRARAKALVGRRRPTSPRSARTTPSGRTEMGAARRQRSGRSFGSAFKAEPSSSGPSSTLSRRKAHPSCRADARARGGPGTMRTVAAGWPAPHYLSGGEKPSFGRQQQRSGAKSKGGMRMPSRMQLLTPCRERRRSEYSRTGSPSLCSNRALTSYWTNWCRPCQPDGAAADGRALARSKGRTELQLELRREGRRGRRAGQLARSSMPARLSSSSADQPPFGLPEIPS